MATKYPFILFFIDGSMPSREQQLAAERMAPARVAFRNAQYIGTDGSLEICDGVIGEVPKRYADMPTAEEAIAAFVKKRDEEFDAADEEAAKQRELSRAATVAAAEAAAKARADAADKAAAAAADADKRAKDTATEAAKQAKAEKDGKTADPTVAKAAQAAAAWKPNA